MIWINGTFGVGKTTAGTALVDAIPALRLFDPEVVGYMLAHSLKDQSFTDFQDLPAWRTLVPAVALEIRRHTGQELVAVQTVLRQEYWAELTATFDDLGERIFHVVLDADEPTLRNRIENDQQELAGRQWRLDHISRYTAAREWMIPDADLVIDTSRLTAQDVISHIAGAINGQLRVRADG
ncbi:AAA family ATPase [uncultured Arthrobacter sp.]|uniref:AAA family ATPase n=1 Tax=uncultured Arthrobacter sp. TaxID=114050 RepID=UPI003217CF59